LIKNTLDKGKKMGYTICEGWHCPTDGLLPLPLIIAEK